MYKIELTLVILGTRWNIILAINPSVNNMKQKRIEKNQNDFNKIHLFEFIIINHKDPQKNKGIFWNNR